MAVDEDGASPNPEEAIPGRADRPRVAVVMAPDAWRGHLPVQALLRALEDGGVDVVDTYAIKAERQPDFSDLPRIELLSAPKVAPPAHGPQRKGRGGKMRRW